MAYIWYSSYTAIDLNCWGWISIGFHAVTLHLHGSNNGLTRCRDGHRQLFHHRPCWNRIQAFQVTLHLIDFNNGFWHSYSSCKWFQPWPYIRKTLITPSPLLGMNICRFSCSTLTLQWVQRWPYALLEWPDGSCSIIDLAGIECRLSCSNRTRKWFQQWPNIRIALIMPSTLRGWSRLSCSNFTGNWFQQWPNIRITLIMPSTLRGWSRLSCSNFTGNWFQQWPYIRI